MPSYVVDIFVFQKAYDCSNMVPVFVSAIDMLWFLRLKQSLACVSHGPYHHAMIPFSAEAALVVTTLVGVCVPLEVLM